MNITGQNILKFIVGVAITGVVLFLVWYFIEVVVFILISLIIYVFITCQRNAKIMIC